MQVHLLLFLVCVFVFKSMPPPFACHCVLYTSTSWCAVLSGETKQPGLAVSWTTEVAPKCVEIKMRLSVCLRCEWHSCHGWLWMCGGMNTVCSCQLLFFFFLPSLIWWHSLSLSPFQTEIPLVWTHSPGNSHCPSAWLKCDRKEEAENEIRTRYGVGMGWESCIVLQLPSFPFWSSFSLLLGTPLPKWVMVTQ